MVDGPVGCRCKTPLMSLHSHTLVAGFNLMTFVECLTKFCSLSWQSFRSLIFLVYHKCTFESGQRRRTRPHNYFSIFLLIYVHEGHARLILFTNLVSNWQRIILTGGRFGIWSSGDMDDRKLTILRLREASDHFEKWRAERGYMVNLWN